jgi:hypothetical protein
MLSAILLPGAASAHTTSSPPPYYAQAACLEPSVATFVTGPNELAADTSVYNGCPANVSGTETITATVTDCPGIGTGTSSGSYNFQLAAAGGSPFDQNISVSAGCVVCYDHEPIGHPSFHVQVTVTASGVFVYKNTLYRTGSTPSAPSDTSLLSNNPPEVVPPCP